MEMQNKGESNLRKFIDKFKNIPLSDEDIMTLLEGKTNIVRYPDLHKYDTIDQLLQPYNSAVLLYEDKPHSGHWCCVTKNKGGGKGPLVEFFDPYGKFPDSQLDYIPKKYAKESHQNYPYLLHLLYDSPYRSSYNEFEFQEMKPKVKDCGRWCALRILFKDHTLDEFVDEFYGPYSDDIATLVTARFSQLK